jgi:hypothetical protein
LLGLKVRGDVVFGVFRVRADHDAPDLACLAIAGEGDRGDAEIVGKFRLTEKVG